MRPARKRRLVEYVRTIYKTSMRRACELARTSRATAYYRSCKRDRGELRVRLRDLTAVRVNYGYRRLHVLLRRDGWQVNHKLVYRIYNEEGLEVRTKKRRKRVSALRVVLPAAMRPKERWSMDFVSDSLHDGRRFRVLTIVDHFTRESPAIVADHSISESKVVEVLDHLAGLEIRPPGHHGGQRSEVLGSGAG